MTYNTVADILDSFSLVRREHAAIAKEGIDPPEQWQSEHRWKLASQPGWSEAWESAVAGGIEDPGAEDGVITDGMILSAIQSLIAEDNLPPAILVSPGSVVPFTTTDPGIVADPLTPWDGTEFATFNDGTFEWDGGSWVLYDIINP